MKIIVKNLKGNQFEIDVEPSHTVRQVKEKIEEEQKIAADTQKLVAVGKVMSDEKTVEEYKLKEGDFIVVMVSKPKVVKEKKPEPTPAPSQPVSSGSGGMNAPSQNTTTGAQQTHTTTAPPPVPNPTGQAQPTGSSEGGGILRGEALENTLKDMQEMGFPREECMRALRAAYYNPDRAVDYLLNGIPDDADQEQPPSHSHTSGGHHAEGGEGAGANPLSFLQNNPMFSQLRQRLISEPQFFQTFMNQLAQTHPQLHQAISANPQAFLALLLGQGGGEGPENDPPGTIRVTQEEKDAIDRLTQLGFPKHRAIEAFFACDKNEEWAANYLFENGMNDDNYDAQVAQEESRAEAEEQDMDMYGEQHPGGDAHMSSDAPAANQPPAQNPPAQNPPAENPPAQNQEGNNNNNNQNQNNQNNDNNDEEGSSL